MRRSSSPSASCAPTTPVSARVGARSTSCTDRDGRVCGAIGSPHDVTHEREAEQEHRRLLQILEETSDCLLLITRRARILQANAAARRTFGDEIVGSFPWTRS